MELSNQQLADLKERLGNILKDEFLRGGISYESLVEICHTITEITNLKTGVTDEDISFIMKNCAPLPIKIESLLTEIQK